MSDLGDVWGPVVSASQVERALIAHLRLWLGDALKAAADQDDSSTPTANANYSVVPAPPPLNATLPHIVVISPGGTPSTTRENGEVGKRYAVSVATFASADDRDSTQRKAKLYGVAVEKILTTYPVIAEGMRIVAYHGDTFTRTPARRSRSLYCAESAWDVEVDTFLNAYIGPDSPTGPGEDPEPWPPLEHTNLTVRPL